MKTIYLEPDEEITSVVDLLTNTEAKEVALVIPVGAQILQSAVSLKLLKRETGNLSKRVLIVTADQLGQGLAKKANFEVRDKIDSDEIEDFSPELVKQAKKPKEDIIDVLSEEMEIDENEQLEPNAEIATQNTKKDLKSKLAKMTDIVRPSKGSFVEKKEEDKELKEEIEVPITKTEAEPETEAESKAEVDKAEEPTEETTYRIEDLENDKENKFQQPKEEDAFKSLKSEYEAKDESEEKEESLEDLLDEPQEESQKPLSAKRKQTFFQKILASKIFYITTAIVVIILGSVIYSSVQKAEVILTLKTERISFDLQVDGSNDIAAVDIENNRLPIQLLKKPESLAREFEATGEKEIKEKAVGIVTIYNEYSSSEQVLVAATRLQSPDGLIFRTVETVEIPGASIEEGKIIASLLDVEVEADQSGSDYNIGPEEFTIPGFEGTPKFAGFYGRSTDAMAGGRVETIKIVTEDDVENAKEALSQELLEKGLAKKALEDQMPQDLKLVEDAIIEEIIGSSSTVSAGEEAANFRIEVTAQSQALVFNEQNLNSIVDAQFSEMIEEDRVAVPDSKKISWDKPDIDWDNVSIELQLHIEEDVAWQIDTEKVKNELSGMDEVEARKYLGSVKNIQKAKVTFWPFWVRTIPSNLNRIDIITQ